MSTEPAMASVPAEPAMAPSPQLSTDEPPSAMPPALTDQIHLRVLIISGQYHVFSFAPETTVGRMKELVWSMWPSEWTQAQPPQPAFLRVLYAGRILADDSTLLSNGLPTSMTPKMPTVIHLSVRSFSIRAEDDAKKPQLGRASSTRSRTRNPEPEDIGSCKCLIQ
ncbi:hypothetical protein Q5752_006132 [Cryptotrichosporon argae]